MLPGWDFKWLDHIGPPALRTKRRGCQALAASCCSAAAVAHPKCTRNAPASPWHHPTAPAQAPPTKDDQGEAVQGRSDIRHAAQLICGSQREGAEATGGLST